MRSFTCTPLKKNQRYEVTVPGSKSITNRALLLGALGSGRTVLKGVLFSDDSRVCMLGWEARFRGTGHGNEGSMWGVRELPPGFSRRCWRCLAGDFWWSPRNR